MTDVSHTVETRRAAPVAAPGLVRDPGVVESFLSDAAPNSLDASGRFRDATWRGHVRAAG